MSMSLTDFKLSEWTAYRSGKAPVAAGISKFLKNPTRYNFICSKESTGEVLSASLNKTGELQIVYKSFWPDGDHSGIVTGIYIEKDDKFNGRYQTNDGRFSGEINSIITTPNLVRHSDRSQICQGMRSCQASLKWYRLDPKGTERDAFDQLV